MRLIARLATKSALKGLAAKKELGRPGGKFRGEHVEQVCHGDGRVRATGVHLAVAMHAKPPTVATLHAQVKVVQGNAAILQRRQSRGGPYGAQGEDGRI